MISEKSGRMTAFLFVYGFYIFGKKLQKTGNKSIEKQRDLVYNNNRIIQHKRRIVYVYIFGTGYDFKC